ncbi:heme ABC transporter ATP-binding protein [Agaribacterium haliotis]|uniref:heme ABC transporter ATP-binding protein n=1 Tax=Agaribacterium haliotis TaxID=2013869 RepID=UPI000BB52CEC|nr:heme ABC transporter ATP-binding protein [Agaribacterium haliotis]
MLSCRNLSFKREKSQILNNISFDLGPGLHAILGPNGAGKSTLLNCLSGELKISAGHIQLGDKELELWPEQLRARSLAVLPQKSNLHFAFSVEEVVKLGRTPHSSGQRVDNDVVHAALQSCDLIQLKYKAYTELSGGEQQRCQLARIFAQLWRKQDSTLRVLLLDEPSSALDIKHQYNLMNQLKEMANEGCSIICVMHDFNLVSQYADSLLMLHRGHLVQHGPTETCLNEKLFSDVFEKKALFVQHPITGKKLLSFYD